MLIEWMRIIDLKDVHLHKVALSQNSDYDRKINNLSIVTSKLLNITKLIPRCYIFV